MPPSKTAALTALRQAQQRLDKAESVASTLAQARALRMAEAQEAGASYADIQAVTGLSATRVTQVLRRTRNPSTN